MNPLVRSGSSLCASLGLVPIGVRVLGVKSLEGFNFVVEYPPRHAAIACCMRCVGSYNMGFGVFSSQLCVVSDSTDPVIFSTRSFLDDSLGRGV